MSKKGTNLNDLFAEALEAVEKVGPRRDSAKSITDD